MVQLNNDYVMKWFQLITPLRPQSIFIIFYIFPTPKYHNSPMNLVSTKYSKTFIEYS
jgi:hypothetical protein